MKRLLLLVGIVLLVGGMAFADTDTAAHDVSITINEVAQLGVDGTAIEYTIDDPATPGDLPEITFTIDSNIKNLYYTSVVASGSVFRTITVGSIAVPAGLELLVAVTTPTGSGTVGTAAVSAIDMESGGTLVNDIGSCATGSTGDVGAKLTYTLSIDDIGSLFTNAPAGVDLGVTYTLTDAS